MAPGAQIDYAALLAKHGGTTGDASASGGGVDYDALLAKHGGSIYTDPNAAWDALKDKYGLPHSVDLSKTLTKNWRSIPKEDFNKIDIDKFSQAYQEANPQAPTPTSFLGRSWDEVKNLFKGAFGEGALFGGSGEAAGIGGYRQPNPQAAIEAARDRESEFAEHPAAAAGATAVDIAALTAPFLPELGGMVLDKVNPLKSVESALTRRLSAEEAAAPRSPSESQPALNVSPNDALIHASNEGIKLTPGQALEDPAATNVQKMGTNAMVGGKDLALALREQRRAFVDSVNKLGKTVDPTGLGINDETAGHTIQKNVQDNLDSLRGKATAAYNQVSQQQQDLVGNLRSLYGLVDDKQFEKLTDPKTGVVSQRPIYQPPTVKAALEDISDAPKRLGQRPTIASMRSLRSEFWEKANDYSGNIPDSARALYKQAASLVDNSIMEAATGTPFEGTFRNANSQWKALQSKYNEPGQPLYKILQQDDPTKIVAQLQNVPATDIAMLRKELNDGPAVQALRRSVVNDISNNKFTVRNGGLGGYSHEYLNALFGPDVTKELYLKSDLARRIGYDANPSGTGSAMSVLEQGGSIKNQPKLTAFARLSMPRDPLSFLPAKPTVRTTPFSSAPPAAAVSPITGGKLATPSELFKTGTNP